MFAIIVIESKRRKVQVYLFSSTAISTDSARSLNPQHHSKTVCARSQPESQILPPPPSVVLREARGRSITNYYYILRRSSNFTLILTPFLLSQPTSVPPNLLHDLASVSSPTTVYVPSNFGPMTSKYSANGFAFSAEPVSVPSPLSKLFPTSLLPGAQHQVVC